MPTSFSRFNKFAIFWLLGASLLGAIIALSVRAALPAHVDGDPLPSLAPMLERVMPGMVNIATVTQIATEQHPLLRDPFFRRFFEIPGRPRERENQSLGSGVIVDAERGLILTNHHVIENADAIRVTLHDGRRVDAELIGSDPETDIAVLHLNTESLGQQTLTKKPLTEMVLADSDQLRVGDFVVAIGSPFGLAQTVTSGIVSALGRSGLGIEGYESFIQTDASINPGNSGGPLVNLRGELVGLNTAILASGGGNVGIGFAIPTSMVRTVVDQILEHGGVRRGLFGAAAQDLTPELSAALGIDLYRGAMITTVEPGSAAERAGLRPGDIITDVDDHEIGNSADLRNRIGLLSAGSGVELNILRNGKNQKLHGELADPFADFVQGKHLSAVLEGALIGETVRNTAHGRRQLVALGPLRPGSPAWLSGLREGDLILQLNRQPIGSLDDLRQALAAGGDQLYSVQVLRDGQLIQLARRQP